ncbi:hypothetical protein C8T65DRAFT_740607 [Cerioporus squamosus]|nr:hypothetical protein C8T65DRAFT_740607 [Cerioporus squamosus]
MTTSTRAIRYSHPAASIHEFNKIWFAEDREPTTHWELIQVSSSPQPDPFSHLAQSSSISTQLTMSSAPSNATAPTAPQLPPNLTLLAGPQLLGAFLAWGLQGVLTLQCYMYYTWFPQDRRLLKLLVWGTFIWEWVQIGLVTQSYFEIYVYDYGSIQSLTSYHNTWFSAPIMTACRLFRRTVLLRVEDLDAVVLEGAHGSDRIRTWRWVSQGGVILLIIQANAVEASLNRIIVSVGVITATVVDALIAGSMAYLLLSSKTGIKQSDAMIHKLVRLGVETGALTAAVALVYAIAFMTHTNDLLFECPALVLPKLYSNTFLVSLNNRAFTSRPGVLTQSFTASAGSSTVPASRLGNRALFGDTARVGSHRGIRIDVSQETYPTRDTSKDVIDLVPMGREERSGSV